MHFNTLLPSNSNVNTLMQNIFGKSIPKWADYSFCNIQQFSFDHLSRFYIKRSLCVSGARGVVGCCGDELMSCNLRVKYHAIPGRLLTVAITEYVTVIVRIQ